MHRSSFIIYKVERITVSILVWARRNSWWSVLEYELFEHFEKKKNSVLKIIQMIKRWRQRLSRWSQPRVLNFLRIFENYRRCLLKLCRSDLYWHQLQLCALPSSGMPGPPVCTWSGRWYVFSDQVIQYWFSGPSYSVLISRNTNRTKIFGLKNKYQSVPMSTTVRLAQITPQHLDGPRTAGELRETRSLMNKVVAVISKNFLV